MFRLPVNLIVWTKSLPATTSISRNYRQFGSSTLARMPQELKRQEIDSKTDPSVAKQYDNESPIHTQLKDFYELVDGMKVSMLNTYRNGVGPVGRSMAVAKRSGPDFLFLGNKHSQKFSDLEKNKEVQITFQNSKTQDWVTVSGKATTIANDDPRIKELYTPIISAWFGDLGDGVHTGKAEDPRMALIEIKSNYVSYYKKTTGTLGFAKEVIGGAMTGQIADTGVLRELQASELEKARSLEQ